MKVAYNSCFGGFGLSNKALNELAKKKGIVLTWYEQVGYEYEGNELYRKVIGIPKGKTVNMYPLTEDAGDEIEKLPDDTFYFQSFYRNESRCDSDLIDIIECMGSEANGIYADLRIAEIPDDVSFEITEHAGHESIEPIRMSW